MASAREVSDTVLFIHMQKLIRLEITDVSLQFGVKIDVVNQKGRAGVKVDRAGFEPAASALRTRRSCQTDLPAHF